MLALYADRRFLGSPAAEARHPHAAAGGDALPHVPLLVPFWGELIEVDGDPLAGRYERFRQVGRSFLELTSLDECDVAVFPQSWAGVVHDPAAFERAQELLALARSAGKPMAVFFWSDLDDPVALDAVVFRTSLLRSRRRAGEFAQPAWSEDFLVRYRDGRVTPRMRSGRPTVGFCGFAPVEPPTPTIASRARRVVGDRKRVIERRLGRISPGHAPRAAALHALARSPAVDTNFQLRTEFMGGAFPNGGIDIETLLRVRQEYVQNMLASDYVLCARGGGNFSYRLYETLSFGRIPVFIDTDCVLPLDFAVDWRDYCVWVDERDVGNVGERVAEFHERLSDAEFVDLQHACRRFWETHLSPEGFFSHLHRHF